MVLPESVLQDFTSIGRNIAQFHIQNSPDHRPRKSQRDALGDEALARTMDDFRWEYRKKREVVLLDCHSQTVVNLASENVALKALEILVASDTRYSDGESPDNPFHRFAVALHRP